MACRLQWPDLHQEENLSMGKERLVLPSVISILHTMTKNRTLRCYSILINIWRWCLRQRSYPSFKCFPPSSHHNFHFGQIESESADFHPGADRHFDILEKTAVVSLTNEICCSIFSIFLVQLIPSLANCAAKAAYVGIHQGPIDITALWVLVDKDLLVIACIPAKSYIYMPSTIYVCVCAPMQWHRFSNNHMRLMHMQHWWICIQVFTLALFLSEV